MNPNPLCEKYFIIYISFNNTLPSKGNLNKIPYDFAHAVTEASVILLPINSYLENIL